MLAEDHYSISAIDRSIDGGYEGLTDKLTFTGANTNESDAFSGKTRMQKNAYRLSTLLPIIASLRAIVSPRIPGSEYKNNQLRNHRFIRFNETKLHGSDVITIGGKQ